MEQGHYENGQLEYEVSLCQGQWHGVGRWWDRDGRLWMESQYRLGQPHGVKRRWYNDGQLMDEMYFLCGKPVARKEYEAYKAANKE